MEIKIKEKATRAYAGDEEKEKIPWIIRDPDTPYFLTEAGESWHPIGHNDAMSWPNLVGMFTDPDMRVTTDYLRMLHDHGATCLRLMMENCDVPGFMLEEKVGVMNERVVRFWDEFIYLCEKFGIRLLLTPFDTFWMWLNWDDHPYNSKNGGPCKDRSNFISDPKVLEAVEKRFEFMVGRWSGSGAIFAWDLWNEVHPAYSMNKFHFFSDYLSKISTFIRKIEKEQFGKTHLQTASIFGPLITDGSRAREVHDYEQFLGLTQTIYESDFFDFATVHTYDEGTLDNPANTVDPAISMGKLTAKAISKIHDRRPYFDTEHGPIHSFKDLGITLPQDFDEEYFLLTQWAHFASGGAGGGMRWPNRHPHTLTSGMYEAQLSLNRFIKLVDWRGFDRRNITDKIEIDLISLEAFGLASKTQAIVWIVRKNTLGPDGMMRYAEPIAANMALPGMEPGRYSIKVWNTKRGEVAHTFKARADKSGRLFFETPYFVKDVALYIKKSGRAGKK